VRQIKHYGFTPIADFAEVKEAPYLSPKKNKPFKLAALVPDVQNRVTTTGRNFGILAIEDLSGKTENYVVERRKPSAKTGL
jgi:DNA polymerase-3 subunit alpha